MSYLHIQGQRSMALDSRRNRAYTVALRQVITPESVVLDLGAGLGIHGLLAAQLGAKQLYLVEPEDIITVANQISRENGYGSRVRCFQGKIEEVNLPEQVDVIISVFTGNFLLEEDLLPSLFYARDKYLKPRGFLIPQAAVMQAVPVCVPSLYEEEINIWSHTHMGINLSAAQTYASNAVYYYKDALSQAQYLAEPANLLELNFYQSTNTYCQVEVSYQITETGLCHGWAGWFKMLLGETWLSTSPHNPKLHWSAAFLPLDPPIKFITGETVTFCLQRPLYGDWSWQVKTDSHVQQHSTFFAVPMSSNSLKKVAFDYQPDLTPQGEAVLYVLSHSNGSLSLQQLSESLQHNFPELFTNSLQAVKFVQDLVKQYG